MGTATLICGDVFNRLSDLPAESVQCVVTSPPYWGLRDYGQNGQLGLEATPDEYVSEMVAVFRETRRVLRKDGTCWLNLGDSYAGNVSGGPAQSKSTTMTGGAKNFNVPPRSLAGLRPKNLVGIPWRVALSLQKDGWWLRSDIIWSKSNPMPESVTDRPTKSHEHVFLLAKSQQYFYDHKAIKEPCVGDIEKLRNARDVWRINSHPYPEAHFATFPPKLVEPCIKAGSAKGDTVLDPFTGSGTTGVVALELDRNFVGIELNPEYILLAEERISNADSNNIVDVI